MSLKDGLTLRISPYFSVITVCYNSSKTLQRCIDSVERQQSEFPDFEYIIIDGASTDTTIDIVRANEAAFGGRLRWISEPDDGLYFAMNKGIAMAHGEVIAFINSDDWFEDSCLKTVFNAFADKPHADIVYGHIRIISAIDPNTVFEITSDDADKLQEGMSISHQACFVKKQVYTDFGVFNTNYKIAADYELLLRFYMNNVKFSSLDSIMSTFSIGGESSKLGRLMKEEYRIQKEYFGRTHAVKKTLNTLFRAGPRVIIRNILGDRLYEDIRKHLKPEASR